MDKPVFSELFIKNKYTLWYLNIIENSILDNRKKTKQNYYERHHILPKSLFPEYKNLSENSWNCVLLTYKEHFLVHWLLTKMFENTNHKRKMFHALDSMRRKFDKRIISSWQYNISRKAAVEARKNVFVSEETRAKLRKPMSEETKQKLRKPKSQETKAKMSASKKAGYAARGGMTEEHRNAILASINETTKQKLSKSLKQYFKNKKP